MGTEMNVELLPCPFCGNDTASVQDSYISGGGHMVLCPSCTAEGPLCTDETAAISEWNRRAAQPADVGAMNPPEMPRPIIATRHGTPAYTVGQMLDYARDAIAADRRAREVTVIDYGNPVDNREASPQAARGVSAADAVSLMLWLYRRLPRAYGRPPHVEAPIAAMAKAAGIEVADSFSERDPAPPLSSEQQLENMCRSCKRSYTKMGRINAAGHCPHCGVEITEGTCGS